MRTQNHLTLLAGGFTVSTAGNIQHGFDSPNPRRMNRRQAVFLRPLHGRVRSTASKFWAAVREGLRPAGSLVRSVNPHSSPSPFDSGWGGLSTTTKESCHV